jgi:hypothetical protein
MLEDAEKNSALDNSKKALVNITYELDNLLLKAEKVKTTFDSMTQNMSNNGVDAVSAMDYFSEIMTEVRMLYNSNNLSKLSETVLEELKYATNILVVLFLKSKLDAPFSNDKKDSGDKNRGVVIDVTEE